MKKHKIYIYQYTDSVMDGELWVTSFEMPEDSSKILLETREIEVSALSSEALEDAALELKKQSLRKQLAELEEQAA
jgi:hypothetical protein